MTAAERIGREPPQRRGKSKQDYGTPWELIRAIEARFGKLAIDLAATPENTKCERYIDPERNSLLCAWHHAIGGGIGWLNPPFGDIAPWMHKAASCGSDLLVLVPASIGSEWFHAFVEGTAPIIGLRPRITFEGCTEPYPKDCMLCVFGDIGRGLLPISTWRWR